ncbi:GAF domain-containing protein [Streptomyces sp. 8K308]|uniref:SpoIIE family protein phosphatase n=1 Tax=Streptomyces sp. 8K308 TaxID=2530388 RepID=UPI00104E32F4|nr:SpoIIE family protein phosphatase [Streptomyces sp. 8K308]TDC12859.1 GAF domain-containing protein [Streptomyces sp. 8K308]
MEGFALDLDALGTGAELLDGRGIILGVNAWAQRLLARPAAELVGQDEHDLLHRDRQGGTLPRAQCRLRKAILAGETAQTTGEWAERGDGSLLRVSWLATPCELGDGRRATLVLFHPESAGQPASRLWGAGAPITELERLALLAEATTVLAAGRLEVDETLERLVDLVLPRLADWAVVDLITERDEVWRFAVAHTENDEVVRREDLEGALPPVPRESPMPLARALRGAASTAAEPETYQGPLDSGIALEQRRLFAETGMHSAITAPIRGPREVMGALTLGRSEQPARFTAADIALLEDISRRAGIAVENARLYQGQRRVAETMQRHLLPQMPYVPSLELTVRYAPASDASQVGGDWYDAFALADGATALVIGDVVGHDLDAAAGMAQLRNMLRAYAWTRQRRRPSKIVERLDEAASHIAEISMATMIFARLEVTGEGRCELSWTNAGHPSPLLITHDGLVHDLTGGHGVLLGVAPDRARTDAKTTLPPGSTLLFFTDGLVESPSRSIDEGLYRLRREAAALAHRPLESFTDRLLSRARAPGSDDDVALLALRVPHRLGPPEDVSRRPAGG